MKSYKVVTPLKHDDVLYGVGDVLELSEDAARLAGESVVAHDNAKKEEPETKEVEDAAQLKHIGFGKYRLPNGEVVKGKAETLAALKLLNEPV